MGSSSENVRVAVTGAVYAGPDDATLPTSETAAVTGFTDLGYVSEDGVTETRDRSTQSITAWQNAAKVREVVTEASLTYQLTLIETTEGTLSLYYGKAVTATAGKAKVVVDPGATGGRKRFVIDVIDGDHMIRTVIPSGEVTEVGDQEYVAGGAIGYPVTITCYQVSDETDGPHSAIKYYAGLPVVGE